MMLKHALKVVLDSEHADKALYMYAEMERSLLASTFDLADAANIDRQEAVPDPEGRKEVLKALISAVMSGSFEEWWAEEIGAELYDSEPAAKHVGAGTDSDEWQSQLDTWAAGVRAQYEDLGATDREAADLACREVYGADLDAYEARVVEWDRRDALDRLAAGNFREAKRLVDEVTDELREGTDE